MGWFLRQPDVPRSRAAEFFRSLRWVVRLGGCQFPNWHVSGAVSYPMTSQGDAILLLTSPSSWRVTLRHDPTVSPDRWRYYRAVLSAAVTLRTPLVGLGQKISVQSKDAVLWGLGGGVLLIPSLKACQFQAKHGMRDAIYLY